MLYHCVIDDKEEKPSCAHQWRKAILRRGLAIAGSSGSRDQDPFHPFFVLYFLFIFSI